MDNELRENSFHFKRVALCERSGSSEAYNELGYQFRGCKFNTPPPLVFPMRFQIKLRFHVHIDLCVGGMSTPFHLLTLFARRGQGRGEGGGGRGSHFLSDVLIHL